jgi:hypothetical protein
MTLCKPAQAGTDLSRRKTMHLYHHTGGVTSLSRRNGVKAMPPLTSMLLVCLWLKDIKGGLLAGLASLNSDSLSSPSENIFYIQSYPSLQVLANSTFYPFLNAVLY